MLIILLIFLLMSNAVTTRQEKSILFARIVIKSILFISYLAVFSIRELIINPIREKRKFILFWKYSIIILFKLTIKLLFFISLLVMILLDINLIPYCHNSLKRNDNTLNCLLYILIKNKVESALLFSATFEPQFDLNILPVYIIGEYLRQISVLFILIILVLIFAIAIAIAIELRKNILLIENKVKIALMGLMGEKKNNSIIPIIPNNRKTISKLNNNYMLILGYKRPSIEKSSYCKSNVNLLFNHFFSSTSTFSNGIFTREMEKLPFKEFRILLPRLEENEIILRTVTNHYERWLYFQEVRIGAEDQYDSLLSQPRFSDQPVALDYIRTHRVRYFESLRRQEVEIIDTLNSLVPDEGDNSSSPSETEVKASDCSASSTNLKDDPVEKLSSKRKRDDYDNQSDNDPQEESSSKRKRDDYDNQPDNDPQEGPSSKRKRDDSDVDDSERETKKTKLDSSSQKSHDELYDITPGNSPKSSLIDDYADVSTEMPSYMDPED